MSKAKLFWLSSICGILLLASSLTASAATDNERWNQAQAELQKQLAPGSPAADYRKKIEGLGYQITSTNYNSRSSGDGLLLNCNVHCEFMGAGKALADGQRTPDNKR